METTVRLAKVSCCVCGSQFAIPEGQLEHLKDKGGDFWCPNGHQLHFGQTTVDKLRREISALQGQLTESREEITRQKNVVKSKNEKFQKARRRINAGVCPHCHRSFRALARHVQTCHPQEPLPNK